MVECICERESSAPQLRRTPLGGTGGDSSNTIRLTDSEHGMPLQRAIVRRIGLVLAGTVLAALTLPLLVPMWQREDGRTFCYPFFGPVERFNPDLSGSLLARARAHEDAHAAQCRRDGAVWHFVRRLAPSQRLMAEAEAYCAEATFGVANGGQARLEYGRIQDELREARLFRRFSSAALADALTTRCPELAATAAREEAEWRAARARRRAA